MFEEIEIPGIEVETDKLGTIVLTWLNTTIKSFKETRFNHVEYEQDERGFIFIPSVELEDFLHENNYPEDYRPLVDDLTHTWYTGRVAMLFSEIIEIMGEEDEI